MYQSCIEYFSFETIENGKFVKCKVLDLFEYYNFDIESVSVRDHLEK
jgi:hypothetical protein